MTDNAQTHHFSEDDHAYKNVVRTQNLMVKAQVPKSDCLGLNPSSTI